MQTVKIKDEFSDILINRNKLQGDGKFTAQDFRKKFLKDFESKQAWENPNEEIEFDFSGVRKISPSFANEAFAHFLQFTKKSNFYKKIKFSNMSKVQELIINEELTSAEKDRC